MPADSMLYSPVESPMSSLRSYLNDATVSIVMHLLGIFAIALVLNRLLRVVTNLLIKHAAGQSRAEQVREQQTRTLASVVFSTGSKAVWPAAILTALDKVGINPTPALNLAGLDSVAVGFRAANMIRDPLCGVLS